MAKRKALTSGKTGIYIRLDQGNIDWAKEEAGKLGIGYQTFINDKLTEARDLPSIEKRVSKLEKKMGVK